MSIKQLIIDKEGVGGLQCGICASRSSLNLPCQHKHPSEILQLWNGHSTIGLPSHMVNSQFSGRVRSIFIRSYPAFFACFAVLFTLPVALLSGRYLRHHNNWFKVHIIFNTITTLLVILVFGLGMGSVHASHLGMQFAGEYSDLHHKVGAAVLSIVLMQSIIGFAAHYTRPGSFLRRLHIPFGIIAAAGLYWNTWEGMHNEWPEMSVAQTYTPNGVQVVFWVLFLISATAYGIGVGTAVLNNMAAKPVQLGPDEVSVDEKRNSDEKTRK